MTQTIQWGSLTSQAALLRLCGAVAMDSADALSVSVPGPVSGFTTATIPRAGGEPAAVLEQAATVAQETGRGQLVWAPADSALALSAWQKQCRLHSALAVMWIEPRPDASGHEDAGIMRVTDPATAELFRQVHAPRFTGERAGTVAYFGRDQVLLSEDIFGFVLVQGDKAVCAGYLHQAEADVAGVYWVATRSALQRRGFAAALMRTLIREAAQRGVRQLVLQATPAGRAVYRRLGFTDAGLVLRWTIDPSEA